MKKRLEIINVEGKNYIVADNEAFDWEIEPEKVAMIELNIKNDPLMKNNFIGSIFNQMTVCFSEFIGKKISLKEINDAIDNGYIEI